MNHELQDYKILQYKPVRVDEWWQAPDRAYPEDAGYDLATSEDVEIPPGGFLDVPTNIAMLLPTGTWGYLVGRSSTLRKLGLLVAPGVIDGGYTGELYAGVQNLTSSVVRVAQGDRLSQIIIHTNTTEATVPQFAYDGFNRKTVRGTAGFGSSGK